MTAVLDFMLIYGGHHGGADHAHAAVTGWIW